MDHIDTLKGMLQDIINDRPEQAKAALHDYFVAKSCELTQPAATPPTE